MVGIELEHSTTWWKSHLVDAVQKVNKKIWELRRDKQRKLAFINSVNLRKRELVSPDLLESSELILEKSIFPHIL